ncbi:hypothetical protein [Flavobacterium ardleyense]|uniref:hypothetical protein n=1 Tax=Flavobacterium ardleyense TaxID=2038737 RepID=UPI00298C0C51|nr:hypothetical protein [Flavobacterium ardleyense]
MKKKILLLLLIVAQMNAFAFDKTARTEYDDYSNDDYETEMVGYSTNEVAAPIDSWTPFLLLAGVLYSVYYFEKKRKSSAVTK